MHDFKIIHVQDCGYTYTLIESIVDSKVVLAVTDDPEKEGNLVFGGKLIDTLFDDQ